MNQFGSKDTEYNYERFKWSILADATTEGAQGLWEPLWELRSCYEIPGLTESERQELAERALRELYAEDLIYFFAGGRPRELEEAANDFASRLDPNEVDTTLKSEWWRIWASPQSSMRHVWWCATAKGEAAYANPPVDIRAFWERRATPNP